jgi:hypothetical protein
MVLMAQERAQFWAAIGFVAAMSFLILGEKSLLDKAS